MEIFYFIKLKLCFELKNSSKIMWKTLRYGSPLLMGTLLPLDWKDHDRITENNAKTASDYYVQQGSSETGTERIRMMFQIE
jgi:hypothetical protein